jgi:hypothetical protein
MVHYTIIYCTILYNTITNYTTVYTLHYTLYCIPNNGNLQKQKKTLIGKFQRKEQLGSIHLNRQIILK